MDIIKEIKLKQLRKERQAIRDNRKAWIEKHKHSTLDSELARVFKAYENAINQLSQAIRNVKIS
tara:strand:- start:511 stop:702 length:192 start_codon:yes stop_codon:yes gene_type:complete